MNSIPQKHCFKCDQFKDVSAYGRNKHYKDGLDNWCRECRRAYNRKDWQGNPALRERKRNQMNDRYHNNPEHKRKQIEYAMRAIHARRARKEQQGGSYTAQEWRDLCAKYGHVCLCCGKAARLTPDHVVPIAKGGSNDISNIQPLCLPCNLRKGTKTTDYRPAYPPVALG